MEFKSYICDRNGNVILHCTNDKRNDVMKLLQEHPDYRVKIFISGKGVLV